MDKQTLCIIMGGGCGQLQSASGVLKALDQQGISFDKYLGSSAGACIAGLHGSGLSGAALCQIIKDTPVQQLYQLSIWGVIGQVFGLGPDYVYSNEGIHRLLQQYMTTEARDKVRVTITDADTFDSCTVPATPVTVLASAAIPHIFRKVRIGRRYYVDGGVKNMIPVPKITQLNNYKHIYMILCPQSSVQPQSSFFVVKAAHAFLQTMDRQITQIYEQGWGECPNVTIIQPPPTDVKLLGWSPGFTVMQSAYNYTKQLLQKG